MTEIKNKNHSNQTDKAGHVDSDFYSSFISATPAAPGKQLQKAIIHDVIEWINAHQGEHLEVEVISKISGYSRWHLMRVFKEQTGTHLGVFLREKKIMMALKEIITTRKSMTMIALDAGFDGPQSFSRTFKNKFNLTPTQIRKKAIYYFNKNGWITN